MRFGPSHESTLTTVYKDHRIARPQDMFSKQEEGSDFMIFNNTFEHMVFNNSVELMVYN